MRSQTLVRPAGRQGPGPLPAAAVATLDVALVRRAGGLLPGEHRAPGVGTGTELAQLRPYEPGDDLRQLDPAASARTMIPHVRQQVPERALTTWVILDVSPSMAFGTATRLKSDVAEGVCAAVAQVAVRRGGRIALIACGAPGRHVLPPRGGRGAVARVRRLAGEGVAPDGSTPSSHIADALGRVRNVARLRGLVIVISDFRDTSGWERAVAAVGARHAVIGVEVTDAGEAALPAAGMLVVVDPETGEQVEVDTASPRLRAAFAAAEAERRERVRSGLRRAGAHHVTLTTGDDWLRELARGLA